MNENTPDLNECLSLAAVIIPTYYYDINCVCVHSFTYFQFSINVHCYLNIPSGLIKMSALHGEMP